MTTGGHLFVIDGNLTKLSCDAVLIPTDYGLIVTSTWLNILEMPREGRISSASPPAGWGHGVRSFCHLARPGHPQVWLGDIGRVGPDDLGQWYADGLVDFVQRASRQIEPPTDRPLRLPVNIAGSGEGGSKFDKGALFTTIIPALVEAARELAVDVVVVCWGRTQYAAAQRARQRLDLPLAEFGDRAELLEPTALAMAERARRKELVLFVGAGVSMGAGLPSWTHLMQQMLDEAGSPAEHRDRVNQLDVRDQAMLLQKLFGEPKYEEALGRHIRSGLQYSLAHGLLSSLNTRENITTNYDNLFETAATSGGRHCAVLPYQPVQTQERWLLKLHGSIDKPSDIVLTRDDYLGLPGRAGALFGIMQAMLMTRHMLFIGYSLTDDSFHKVMHEVRQAQAGLDDKVVGTALVLYDDPVLTDLWGDNLNIVAICPRPEDSNESVARAARQLDLFLDRVGLLAADVTSFLLDSTYDSMLDDEERSLSHALGAVADLAGSLSGPMAERLRETLAQFGRQDLDDATVT